MKLRKNSIIPDWPWWGWAIGAGVVGGGIAVVASKSKPQSTGLLLPGQILMPGQGVTSPSGKFRLVFLPTLGALSASPVNAGSVAFWSSNNARPGAYAIMQKDGNLVIYGSLGNNPTPCGTASNQSGCNPIWDPGSASGQPPGSGTSGNPGAYLAMQDDGNIVIYKAGPPSPTSAIWASNTLWAAAPGGRPPATSHTGFMSTGLWITPSQAVKIFAAVAA